MWDKNQQAVGVVEKVVPVGTLRELWDHQADTCEA